MKSGVWGEFARSNPEFARHIEERLASPKICNVSVNFRDGRMVVVMYPSSPKGP